MKCGGNQQLAEKLRFHIIQEICLKELSAQFSAKHALIQKLFFKRNPHDALIADIPVASVLQAMFHDVIPLLMNSAGSRRQYLVQRRQAAKGDGSD